MSQPQSNNFLEQDLPCLVGLKTAYPNLYIATQSSPDYEQLLEPFNLNNSTRALAFVCPKNESELAAAVKFCTSQTPPISLTVRSGGHDIQGRYIAEDAVLLDISGIKKIDISPDQHSVTIGTGVQGIDLFRILESQGLAAAVGWCGRVSVTGWAAGGGYGVTNGLWGLGVDNILGAKVVTPGPNGKVVDTDDDAELLWAIRGAGLGNFGVISEVRLKLYRRPRHLAGALVFPLAEGRAVLLDGLQRLEKEGEVPGNFNAEFFVSNTPGLGATVTFLWSWMCHPDNDQSLQRGWDFLQQFRGFGTVLLNTVAETSLLSMLELNDSLYTGGDYMHLNSSAISDLTPELIDVLINNPPPENDFRSIVLFHHAHHRAAEPNPNAVFNIRRNHYIYGLTGSSPRGSAPEEREQAAMWAENVFRSLKAAGLSMKEGYCSFSRPEHIDAEAFFGKKSVERLRALKRKYNPDSAFPKAYPVL